MKSEVVEKFYMINGKLESTDGLEVFDKIKNLPIYEVIRVIDGIPLFLEEHLERMRKSAFLIDYPI